MYYVPLHEEGIRLIDSRINWLLAASLLALFASGCKQESTQPAPQLAPPAAAAEEPTLRTAKITFCLPKGDDKDDNTTVSVAVTTKVDNQWDQTIASLDAFGDQIVWEDDGKHCYPYDLKVVGGTNLGVVRAGGVRTKIDWMPTGRDRGFFNYKLVLTFDDSDTSTHPTELQQTNPKLVEMSENIPSYTNP